MESYLDEIESIEELDYMEMIDIQVSGDNLFFANDILVKNSFGIPMTLDCMLAILQNDEMSLQNKYVLKVLKTRFGSNVNQFYSVGVDKNKMTLTDLADEDQVLPISVRDKQEAFDEKRKMFAQVDDDGDERAILFEDEL